MRVRFLPGEHVVAIINIAAAAAVAVLLPQAQPVVAVPHRERACRGRRHADQSVLIVPTVSRVAARCAGKKAIVIVIEVQSS